MKIKKLTYFLTIILIFLLSACNDNEETIHIDQTGCNVFAMGGCLTPFPSDQFLVETNGRKTISLPQDAFLPTRGGTPFPVQELSIFDGFSPASQIMVLLNGRINRSDNFPDLHHPERSTTSASSIQLINTATWQRVPLFAEGDSRSYENNFLLIHPLIRLQPGTTYIVVLRREITPDGSSPPAFRALRDKIETDDPYIENIRSNYESYFSKLETMGVRRNDIFLMWDFTTGTDRNIIGNNLGKILNFVKSYPDPTSDEIIIDSAVTNPDAGRGDFLLKQIHGRIPVPWLMNDDNSRIKRLEDGSVDTEDYRIEYIPFVENIPKCVTNTTPHIMIYGHGLGGSANDIDGYTLRKNAQEWCTIELAVDWYGANYEGLEATIQEAIISHKHPFYGLITMAERLLQGHLDFLMLIKSIPALTGVPLETDYYVYNGDPDYPADITSAFFYYGVSNGGIQGGTLAYTGYTLNPAIHKFALNVNGAVWSILFQRYEGWHYFEAAFLLKVESLFEVTKMVLLAQLFYDFVDPITFAPYYPLTSTDNSIPHLHILSQESMGDAAVSNITTEIWARTAGIPGLAKLIDQPYEIPEKAGPLPTALTQWDGHPQPLPPDTNSPLLQPQTTVVKCGSSYTEAHGVPFCLDTAREQVRRFMETGLVFQLCSGDICDPD